METRYISGGLEPRIETRNDLQIGTGFLFWVDGSVLKLDCGDGCTTL